MRQKYTYITPVTVLLHLGPLRGSLYSAVCSFACLTGRLHMKQTHAHTQQSGQVNEEATLNDMY